LVFAGVDLDETRPSPIGLKILEVGGGEVYRARPNNSQCGRSKKMPNLAGPEEFPAVINALGDKLRNSGFIAKQTRFH